MKKHTPVMGPEKELLTIPGIGKSLSRDLVDLGIHRVRDLKDRDPERLYQKLSKLRRAHIDRCVLYAFRCSVYYASRKKHDPALLKCGIGKTIRSERPGDRPQALLRYSGTKKVDLTRWGIPA